MSGKSKKIRAMLLVCAGILILAIGMAVYAIRITLHVESPEVSGTGKKYEYHLVMIHSGVDDDFWKSLYEGARKEGEKSGAYVEDFGAAVSEDYSTEDLMEMAIAAKVDGIIVEGNQSAEMKELIDRAEAENITVVTMMHDVADSKRKTFVGINTYALGEMYGNQVVDALQKKNGSTDYSEGEPKVVILTDSSNEDSGVTLIYSSIRETISRSLNSVQVTSLDLDKSEDFESQEQIRNIVVNHNTRPDVVVCLSSVDTISCSQTIVEYNLAGEIEVIGYYSAPEVLSGIQNGTIRSSVDVDAAALGETCVSSLNKFLLKGYVSEYETVEIKMITKDNVGTYLEQNKDGGD
ncbi:sugar ABC transporter substrate-binding protein [Hespellia stercorisuis]|uniref:Ribose transport system substrate-binding protein n=1 Tax=Hespellia stercorisuis DSM 15480 TaxID=1121950 RepID=A0A1M6M694_9FIRM|nr:substrate-binding domain-containing protein [Hespellia stercorisuis]SHJ78986.1 ribose transport system substrate-binding protein [Hespellia stercorisuis DSM 15480]